MKPSRQKCHWMWRVGCSVARKTGPCPIVTFGQLRGNGRLFKKKSREMTSHSVCIKARPPLSASSTQRYYFIHSPFLKLHFVRLAQGQTTTHNRNLLLPFLPRPQVFSWDRACHPSLPGPPALLCCLYRRVCMCVSLLFSLWVLEIIPICALSLVAG